ncbi:hypothetical protein Fmac_023371 [Flemingia macrophylla]|uniref:Gnk2-homologous domain-containing protein n=1 Tax=Flemingia macrophylla TaxID=520843 RepID=A0ABD1LLB4_9FABA
MASFKIFYLFILLPFINLITVKAGLDDGLRSFYCSENLTTPNSAFQKNLRTLFSYLSSNATANKQYYNTTVAGRNHSDTVYGMFFCFGDVPRQLCIARVAEATKAILSGSYGNCSLSTDVYFQYEDFKIRYSNRSFFSTPDLTSDSVSCSYLDGSNQKN